MLTFYQPQTSPNHHCGVGSSSYYEMPPHRGRASYTYERAYKACSACRETKSKCILVDGSAPTPTQCRRCKRQGRQCMFPSVRSCTELEGRRCRSKISATQRESSVEQTAGRSSISIRNNRSDLLSASSRGRSAQPKNEQRLSERSASQLSLTHVNAWDLFPFVKAGWLSAGEACFLVNQFFDNIAPWSLVVTEALSSPANQSVLVKDIFLSATLLMIASRFHALPGSSGRMRSDFIHQKLSQQCQNILLDILLCRGMGAKDTRTISTLEALLLLVEWHPEAFDYQVEEREANQAEKSKDGIGSANRVYSASEHPKVNISEFALRVDRTSWALLGCAKTLELELGVQLQGCQGSPLCALNNIGAPLDRLSNASTEQRERYIRLSSLIQIFEHQLSLRLGLALSASPFREYDRLKVSEHSLNRSLRIVAAWVKISEVERLIAEHLLAQEQQPAPCDAENGNTQDNIRVITHLELALSDWLEMYTELLSSSSNSILPATVLLEYHYIQSYAYSIVLQAEFERRVVSEPSNIESYVGQGHLDQTHQTYADTLATSACAFFEIVCHYGETGALKYTPVRLLARVASMATIFLKVLTLPLLTVDMEDCLLFLRNAGKALRSNAADRLHVFVQYADFLDAEVEAFQRRSMRVPFAL